MARQTLADVAREASKPGRKRARLSPTLRRLADKPDSTRRPLKADTGNTLAHITKRDTGVLRDAKQMQRAQAVDDREFHPTKRQALTDELTGKGLAVKAVSTFARSAAPVIVGGQKTVNGHKISTEGIVPGGSLLPDGGLRRRAVEDVLNFPAQAVPSLYIPASAAFQAAKGNTAPGKKFLNDLPKTDPLAALVTGHPKRALKLADAHPGNAALELVGAKGMIGRATGRVLRAAPEGTSARAAGSTVRAPKHGPEGTDLKQPQQYSRDSLAKAGQVAKERVQAARARKTYKRAAETKDADLLRRARKQNPHAMSGHEVRRRLDDRVAANRATAQHHEADVAAAVQRAIRGTEPVKGGPAARAETVRANLKTRIRPSAALKLHIEGITDATPEALRVERDRLVTEHDALPPAQQAANAALRKQINHALAHHPHPDALKKAAADYAAVVKPLQQGLVDRGLLEPAQMETAPLVPYAVKHMGATHGIDAAPEVHAAVTKELLGAAQRERVLAETAHTNGAHPATLQRLKAARGAQAAAEDAHLEAARAAKHAKATPTMLDARGNPLPAAAIRGHMAAHGVPEPPYVPSVMPQTGIRRVGAAPGRAPLPPSNGARTGAATRKGLADASPEVLERGAVNAQRLADAYDGFQETLKEFAHKPTLGKLKDRKSAEARAQDMEAQTGVAWRPVRLQPFGGKAHQLKALLDNAVGEGGLETHAAGMQPLVEALSSAVRGDHGAGPWGLLPEEAAARLERHYGRLPSGPKEAAARVVSSNFRRTVLSTSPTWAAGNTVEGLARAGISRAGPLSYATARTALKRLAALDPGAAHALAARAVGGGHYGSAGRLARKHDTAQFAEGAVLDPVARSLSAFWRQPVARHVAGAWHAWSDIVFRQLNGRLESQIQTAMLGRALRESPLMSGRGLRLSKEAIDQAARGLRGTNEQAALAHEVRRMYGQYDAFSPDLQWAIATYTPFVAWTLNAVKFVYDVLPRDHPALTSLIVASENATEAWRKDHGMDLFIKTRLPGFLQGSLPLSGDRHQRAPFRYTPFGAFGDPLGTAAGAVLPQLSGVLSAFKGEDWKGKKLTKKDGSPADTLDEARSAAGSFLDATVPLLSVVKRVAAGGPGALNPLRPSAPPKRRALKRPSNAVPNLDGAGLGAPSLDAPTLGP